MIDIVSNVTNKIALLGVPLVTLSKLTGISDTELRRIVNRQTECPAAKALRLDATVKIMEQLAAEVAPLPIDWKKAAALQDVIDRVQSGEATFVMNANVSENIPRAIQIEAGKFFVRRSESDAIVESQTEKDAAALPWTLARKVQKLLIERGFKNASIVLSANPICAYRLERVWQPLTADLPEDESSVEVGPRFD